MFFRFTYPALCWAAFIILLTLTSGREFPDVSLVSFDKIVHLFLFAVQSYLFIRGFIRQTQFILLRYYPIALSFIICLFLGASTELMQAYLLTDRAGDFFDFIANVVGAVFGIIIFVWLYGKEAYAKR